MHKDDRAQLESYEEKRAATQARIEQVEKALLKVDSYEFASLARELRNLETKLLVIDDAVSRVSDKNFYKNVPDGGLKIPSTNINRYQK
jgi:hypothetical protein